MFKDGKNINVFFLKIQLKSKPTNWMYDWKKRAKKERKKKKKYQAIERFSAHKWHVYTVVWNGRDSIYWWVHSS